MKKSIIYPKLKPWQLEAYNWIKDSPKAGKVLVIKAKRQVGKNFLANAILLNYCSYGLTSCLLEPTIPQSRRAYSQLVKLLDGSGIIKSANASTLIIEFINGAEIIYKSAGQQLAGFTITGVAIIDEAVYLSDEDIDTFLPTCDANNANIVYISTPRFTTDRFYYEFTNKEPNKLILDWNNWDTSEFLSKERLEEYRKKLTPNKFKSEYLGQFITEDGLLFRNLNNCVKEINSKEVKSLAIDWGTGQSGDYTAIIGLNDKKEVTLVREVNNLSPTEQVKWIANIINIYKPEIVISETNSIGSVYIDMLKKLINIKITNFTTTNKSKQEIVQKLQLHLENNLISLPANDRLLDELRKYQAEVNLKTGSVSYNASTGNDDLVIALMLSLYAIEKNLGNYTLS